MVGKAGHGLLFTEACDSEAATVTSVGVASPLEGVGISNGTDFGYVQNPPGFTITGESGQPFTLISIDLGQAFGSAGGTVTVTRTRFSGPPVETSFDTLRNEFQTFGFGSEWSDLDEVEFLSTRNFLALDNVEVPEPSALCLNLAAVAALARIARSRTIRRITASRALRSPS